MGKKLKRGGRKGKEKKFPISKEISPTRYTLFSPPPFFHGTHRIFACFQFLARLRLATTTTSSHKRQTYWKTRLGSGFTSELSFFWFPSKGEPREILGQNFRLSFNATSSYGSESRNEFHFFQNKLIHVNHRFGYFHFGLLVK